jgi:hypothetical protein
MKKKYLFIVLVCCSSILFMGCPYNSSVSIDDPTAAKIEKKVVGKWQERNSESTTYVVKEKDDHTYEITEKHKKTEGSDQQPDDHYAGFISEVEGTKFLNLYKPDEDPKTYYFYKMEYDEETASLTLYPVTEYITEKFGSSEDLKKYIKQYKELSFFFETKEEYIKAK